MIVLGLTGSIGMGKSSAGAMLEYLGVPVHDADAEVHKLLHYGSEAWYAIAAAFPYFSYPQIYGRKHFWNPYKDTIRYLKREALGKIIFEKPDEREKLEAILHPLVRKAQNNFIRAQRGLGREIVALDVPLLFETGADMHCDYTINISAPAFIQEARVLARPGMNVEKFSAIVESQMPDGEKCARADFVVHSGLGRATMMRELKGVLAKIRAEQTPEEDEQGTAA
ncbi:MAG TPA: dephospho-CoA kinase [Alphaproteobacteria bacterium]|mgnify:CR=1 FL=1|nr:MAG: dephospho-CoA kinase [Rhodospirillales bacterium]HOO82100.1 dephospho-CoA kinase [Alphaproteobacteria bacterium]